MCKLAKKELHNKDSKAFKKLVDSPEFFCRKCGRVANKKGNLCKPQKL